VEVAVPHAAAEIDPASPNMRSNVTRGLIATGSGLVSSRGYGPATVVSRTAAASLLNQYAAPSDASSRPAVA
jgi:hypothetical protein